MSCGGGHLGFPIGIKTEFYRGPSNDYSLAVWFKLSKWFQRGSVLRHFNVGHYGKMFKCLLFRNYRYE
jgi:hypothetical protein